jgi:surface protein
MFAGTSLVNLNIDNFNTNQVTDMSSMFNNTSGLTTVFLHNFDTRNVTDMSNMFANSNFSTLDLSNFNMKQITNKSYMLANLGELSQLALGMETDINGTRIK